jgi:hypothetical protein
MDRYNAAVRRSSRFRGWASICMLLGFALVMYVSFYLHGIQGAVLGMAYSAAVAWCVVRARALDKEAAAILLEMYEATKQSR